MLLTLADVHNGQWSRTEHMLASVIDALGQVGYSALIGPNADPKKLRHVKPPKAIERPHTRRRRRRATGEELASFFAHARNPERG